ncbi:MAG: hemerythrin family protein [Marinilabiliaceae bacterium]|nr:hemerythrin family protein [Marinilabiliaceae bacterium]
MALIQWTPALSVKISSIDDQHKKLFDLLNSFYDGLVQKSDAGTILALAKGMKDYTNEHFTAEERLMEQYGYPALDKHKQEHIVFVKKVEDIEKKLLSGSLIISFEITNFLKDWIKNHIQKTDIQYSSFLIEHGVK